MRSLRVAAVGVTCALALFASDFWKTKDSSQWTPDEADKILNDSPWAKAKSVEPQSDVRRRGRRGGFGFPGGYPGGGYPGGPYPGGGYPGGGYPGGVGGPYPGGGYPGGGGGPYPNGGGNYPNGGGNYPNGGGNYPNGGGNYPNGGGNDPNGGGNYPNSGGNYPNSSGNGGDAPQAGPMHLTIRWDSAAPVQAALMRRAGGDPDELKAVAAASEKYYVITVLGLRLPQQRNRYNDADDHDNGNDNGNDSRGQRRDRDGNDALRSQLLDAAQLAPKGRSSMYAQDVQIAGPGGIDGVRFLFPRTNPIRGADKEVDFILNIRRTKVEEKFKLNDMQYEGKLAL